MKKQSKMRCKKSGFRKKAKNANTKSKRNATKNAKNDLLFFCLTCFFLHFYSEKQAKKMHLIFCGLFLPFLLLFSIAQLHLLFRLLFLLFPSTFFCICWGPSFTFAFFQLRFFRIILSGWHKSTIFPCDYDIEWQTCSARIINPNKKVLVQLSLRILWCQENRWWWTRHCGRTFGASWQGQHLTILTYFDFPKSNQRDKCSQFPSSLIERLPRTLMSDSLYTTLCLTMKSLRRSRVYLTLFDYIWLHLTQMRKTWSCDMHCRHAKAALYNHQSV